MLLRLAYLSVTNVFALLRLLPMSDRDKNVEILALRHQITMLARQLGTTPHPTASWAAQAAKNLVMDLQDAGSRARFLIRDRDGKFPGLFNTVLNDAGIETVLSGVQMPA